MEFDPKQPTKLSVTPGYAVDCHGRDLVLTSMGTAVIPRAGDRPNGKCPYPDPTTGTQKGTFSAGPWKDISLDKMAVFDLVLCYKSIDEVLVAALAVRGGRNCEYTRTHDAAEPRLCPPILAGSRGRRKKETNAVPDGAIQLLEGFQTDVSRTVFSADPSSSPSSRTGPGCTEVAYGEDRRGSLALPGPIPR